MFSLYGKFVSADFLALAGRQLSKIFTNKDNTEEFVVKTMLLYFRIDGTNRASNFAV